MNHPLFSLQFRSMPDSSILGDLVEGWLKGWGTIYERDVNWCANDSRRNESFRFCLGFVVTPETGRRPTDYLFLEIQPPQQSIAMAQRADARRKLLKVLWPGRMLILESHLLKVDPEAAQIRILNAL